jgi:hypothetical protein
MEKAIYHKISGKISKEGMRQLENLRKMNDEDIDYSDAPPLDKKQLSKVARIVMERKERMPLIDLHTAEVEPLYLRDVNVERM